MKNKKKIKNISLKELLNHSDYSDIKQMYQSEQSIIKSNKEILKEFENDKWGHLLSFFLNKTNFSIQDVEKKEFELLKNIICFDKKIGFYNQNIFAATEFQISIYEKTLNKFCGKATALVELGAGYGNKIFKLSSKLKFQNLSLFAGEFTYSGCSLIKHLSNILKKNIQVSEFDFNNPDLTNLNVPSGAIFFTSFSLMYSNKSHKFLIKNLLKFNPVAIIFFEPCYEFLDEKNDHEKFCKKYINFNGYCKNFASNILSICSNLGIKVRVEKNLFGTNPFLPLSIIELDLT